MPQRIKTKAEAFVPCGFEQNVGIDRSQHAFRFTRKWFRNRNQVTFSTFLLPQFDGTQSVRSIQIGVFEGMDLVWQLQNTLRHPESRVVAMDPWLPSRRIGPSAMAAVRRRAVHNLKPWTDRVELLLGKSDEILSRALREGRLGQIPTGHFDYVIIDGDHCAAVVYQDAVNSLNLIRPGGWLVFDDVRQLVDKREHVAAGLRRFLVDYGDRVKQVWSHRFCEAYEKL